MEDETYVKIDCKTLPGTQYYTVKQKIKVDNSDK